MKPTSPFTYYARHKGSATLQIALICLATIGLFVLVAVLEAVPLRGNVSYLTQMSRVIPSGGTLDAGLVSQIQSHPDIQRVIPDNGLAISAPTLLGLDSQRLLGVSPEDAQYLLARCGVRLKEGRMFRPRTNEILLSEEVARALDLQIGSEIARTVDKTYYASVPAPLVLVGILGGDPEIGAEPSVRLGFASVEYLNNHELYEFRPTSLLVVAKPGRKTAADEFLETTIRSQYTEVETFSAIARLMMTGRVMFYVTFGIVNSVVAVAVAFVVSIINQITISRRLAEFGLLHGLGYQKRNLVRRLTLEEAAVAGIGCLLGLAIALLVTSWVRSGPFYDLGMELDLLNPAPFCFVLPIPLAVIALTYISVGRVFERLDAVAIIERGQLGMEETRKRRPPKRSSARPLSSLTFYLRHRRRGVMMILGVALLVLGTAFPVFLLSAMSSAMEPYIEYLQHVSEVAPVANAQLNAGVVSQVKSHPATARTIVAVPLGIQMVVPPGGETTIRLYGVPEADLPILLDAFGVQVREGHLPRPRSNEIVLSAAVATNRGLQVGDVVGGFTADGSGLVDDDMPAEMIVSGILSPARPWIGFASYEYLNSHELTSSRGPRLLVLAHEGQKEALDRWLEGSVDSGQTTVITHRVAERDHWELTRSMVLTFALLECMIAAVAAIALATLNHIFVLQRREEFGVLNAIGRSRRWLVTRLIGETGSVAGVGWIAGAAVCGIGLVGVQTLFYAPRGLNLSVFNLIPWLFTAPLPVSIVLASAVTVARTLSRLDAVSVVERRV